MRSQSRGPFALTPPYLGYGKPSRKRRHAGYTRYGRAATAPPNLRRQDNVDKEVKGGET